MNACVLTPDGQRAVSASADRTLKVWDLGTGRVQATLEGHTGYVNECAVTPDGCYVVSVSDDGTLKVWDLETCTCILTHRGDTFFGSVTATETAVIAGDAAGTVWFLDWPALSPARRV